MFQQKIQGAYGFLIEQTIVPFGIKNCSFFFKWIPSQLVRLVKNIFNQLKGITSES